MPTDAELVDYLIKQEKVRSQRAQQALDALTPREAQLVREAAVASYVNGRDAGRFGYLTIPKDSDITAQAVLTAILQNESNPRHYPLIGAADEGRRPRVKKAGA